MIKHHWQVSISCTNQETKKVEYYEIDHGVTLLEVASKFGLIVAKITTKIEEELRLAQLVIKNNNLDEDDIPF